MAMLSQNLRRQGEKHCFMPPIKQIFKERWPEEFERRNVMRDWKKCGASPLQVQTWRDKVEKEDMIEITGGEAKKPKVPRKLSDNRTLRMEANFEKGTRLSTFYLNSAMSRTLTLSSHVRLHVEPHLKIFY